MKPMMLAAGAAVLTATVCAIVTIPHPPPRLSCAQFAEALAIAETSNPNITPQPGDRDAFEAACRRHPVH